MEKTFWYSRAFRLAIIALWLGEWCAVVHAQPPGTHPSYVSIQMKSETLDSEPVTQAICGGVVVDEKRKLVVTAWHCVPNSRAIIEKPGIFSVNGMNAKFIDFIVEIDMAVFQVDGLTGVKAPKFTTPEKGDMVTASAYYDFFPVNPQGPAVDRFFPPVGITATLDWEGKVAAVAYANERRGLHFDTVAETKMKWIVISGMPAPGFSGGPVFDKNGGFVGILSTNSGGYTNISSSENVAELLKKVP